MQNLIKNPVQCANINRAVNQKLHCYITSITCQVKGEIIRILAWLSILGG